MRNYYDDRYSDRRDRRSGSMNSSGNDSRRYRGSRDTGSSVGRGWYNDYDREYDETSRMRWDDSEGRRGLYGGRDRMDMQEDEDDRGPRERGLYNDYNRSGSGRDWYSRGSYANYNRNEDSYDYDDDDDRYDDYGTTGRSSQRWFGDSDSSRDRNRTGRSNRYSSPQSDYGNRSYRSERSGSGRGWFGDSERHSEAAERGWRRR